MIDWIITVVLSALTIGSMAYMAVWGMHNFEVTVDAIMSWADSQETFLQKLISCPICLGAQVSIALTSIHCIVFHLGLWTWVAVSFLSCLVALLLVIKIDPLTKRK